MAVICARSGKTIYASSGEAHRAIASLKAKKRHRAGAGHGKHNRDLRLHIYRCGHCHGFHTTSRDHAELRRIIEQNGEVFRT